MWKRIADRPHKCKDKYVDAHTRLLVGRGVGCRLMCKRSARCLSLHLDLSASAVRRKKRFFVAHILMIVLM